MRRRYRRRPGARGRLHAPSGVWKHRVFLRAAELRPASRPKPPVEKRTPPLLDLRGIAANDYQVSVTSLQDTQALMTTKFPFIVLAWCVRRQCPAPTPERAHILMAVGNSKIVHVFSP